MTEGMTTIDAKGVPMWLTCAIKDDGKRIANVHKVVLTIEGGSTTYDEVVITRVDGTERTYEVHGVSWLHLELFEVPTEGAG